MWPVEGSETATAYFSNLRPERVLYDLDGPAIFTTRDIFGRLLLAYQCDEDEVTSRFLVVPCQEEKVSRMEAGRASVRAVLSGSHGWIIDVLHSGEVKRAWLVRQDALPDDALPLSGVLLMPSPPESSRPQPQRKSTLRRELPRLSISREDMTLSLGTGP